MGHDPEYRPEQATAREVPEEPVGDVIALEEAEVVVESWIGDELVGAAVAAAAGREQIKHKRLWESHSDSVHYRDQPAWVRRALGKP